MILENEGKNEYASLKVIGQGRLLQSIVFDKIYLPRPLGLSLVHHKKLTQGALLTLGALCGGSPTVFKNAFNKKRKVEHVA